MKQNLIARYIIHSNKAVKHKTFQMLILDSYLKIQIILVSNYLSKIQSFVSFKIYFFYGYIYIWKVFYLYI